MSFNDSLSTALKYVGEPESERAARVDLIVLPPTISGTNCGNCLHFKDGYCTHPDIRLPVTERNCCILWDAEGVGRVAGNEPLNHPLPESPPTDSQ